MPRIATSLLRHARTIDPFLPALLAPCRDLVTAQNELRWLREHVNKVAEARRVNGDTLAVGALLQQLVKERASGKPLQYILGTEYFGDLEIRCRPGVLIPRSDTAVSISHLVSLLRNAQNLPPELRVLDLCTGTGCIPLLFQHELYSARNDVDLCVLGVDISKKALRLASHNLHKARNARQYADRARVGFMKADVLVDPFAQQTAGRPSLKAALNHDEQPSFWDVLVSNPPYISPSAYWKTTTRSVRGFEPKLALVPPHKASQSDVEQGDQFYPRLLTIARDVEAKIVLLEIADLEQALRVARCAQDLDIFDGVEIWRDQPNAMTQDSTNDNEIQLVGQGNARSVICWRGAGASWLGKAVATTSPAEDAQRLFQSSTGSDLNESPLRAEGGGSPEPRFDMESFTRFPGRTLRMFYDSDRSRCRTKSKQAKTREFRR
ncbi:Nn.00g076180.m01.CDS01 [Neocucurbitaria sp. VM-36]